VAYPGGWIQTPQIKIWSVAHQNLEVYVPESLSDFPGTWGPEAKYCQDRLASNPGEQLFIYKQIPFLVNPVPLSWARFDSGSFWQTMMAQITALRPVIAKAEFNPVIDTMLFWQGETDADSWPTRGAILPTALYRYNLASMLDATRLALNAPNMKVVIARIFPSWDPVGFVRQAEVDIGSQPHNAWVDTDDVSKIDNGHADANGIVEVGRRMWLAGSAIM
jgi:hypothetical protein